MALSALTTDVTLVNRYGGAIGVRGRSSPEAAPDLSEPFVLGLAWHPARARDAGIAWLRGVISGAAAAVEGRRARPHRSVGDTSIDASGGVAAQRHE